MSDKGREAIEKLVEDIIGWYWCNSTKKMQESLSALLRSHGWLHEDDVVEGRMKKPERCKGFYDDAICQGIKGNDCPARCWMPVQPMTVKDLIK